MGKIFNFRCDFPTKPAVELGMDETSVVHLMSIDHPQYVGLNITLLRGTLHFDHEPASFQAALTRVSGNDRDLMGRDASRLRLPMAVPRHLSSILLTRGMSWRAY